VNFASWRRSEGLDNVIKEVVKVVNLIITGSLSNRVFGSESKDAICHSEVR